MMFLFKDAKKRNLSNEIIFRYFFVKPYKFNVKIKNTILLIYNKNI